MSRVRALDALDIDLSIAHSIKSIRQLHVANIENCRCNYNSTFQRQYRYDFEKINSVIWANSIEFPHWLVSRFNLNNIAVSFSENKNAPKYEKSSLEPFITVFNEL